MSHSLTNILVHIVFSTKRRQPFLVDKEVRTEMHKYIGGTLNNLECPVLIVGGASDHVHILAKQSKNISTAKLIGEIKRNSSKWIKTKGGILGKFGWQNGYGVFSVGKSEVERVVNYISNQEIHHKKKNFKDELSRMLKKYEIEYDERYLWD